MSREGESQTSHKHSNIKQLSLSSDKKHFPYKYLLENPAKILEVGSEFKRYIQWLPYKDATHSMVGAHCPSFDIIPCLKGEGHHLCGGSAVLQCKCLSEGSRCKHIGRWGDIIWGPGAWSLAHWHYQDTRHDVIIHQRFIIILALLDHSVGDESHHLAHPNFIKIAINDKKSLKLNKSLSFFIIVLSSFKE